MTVRNTHKDYDAYLPQWQRCRDVVKGQDAIHKEGEKYLPKLKNEETTEYTARVKRSDFFNATWRTISALTGMAFNKEPVRELPGILEGYSEDITMSGVNLDAFAEQLVEEVLEVGRIGIMVDHPTLPGNVQSITQAVAEKSGHRPFWRSYLAENIRSWKFGLVDNAWTLKQVVLGETAEIEKDEFETECEDRYRVLDLDEGGFYRQRVFKVEEGKDILIEGPLYPKMKGQAMKRIPFAIIGRSGMGDAIDEPPLIDLVDKNVAHYQVNADYRHGAHYTALPTLFLAGIQDDPKNPIYIGGAAAVTATDPNAKGEFIEYKGQGLGALEKQLDRLERQMAVLGARMIADEAKQVETLGATQIKRTGENSMLARICIAVSEAIEWALGITAEWSGVKGEISYQINREFLPVTMDAQQLTALVNAWLQGALSEEELYDMLQRGDVIDGQKGFEEHQEQVGQAGPALPAPPDEGSMAA